MSKVILQTKNLSKYYSFGTYNYSKFLMILKSYVLNKIDISDRLIALDKINIEIKTGESVAILGRNGLGKTTLCKLLSQVSEPSEGLIKINGKIVPILALTFGIQLETTGIENIRFLATMFGVSRSYIDKKIDEIADFANIKEFLETPLKKYSSGMITRLIFSTLITFPSDLLILDEVLAVSDQSFKDKAILKLKERNKNKLAIICISHEESLIRSICKYAYVFVKRGVLSKKLPIDEGIKLYKKTFKNI